MTTTVTLVYPYFRSPHDNSIFRHPPLGLGYIAAYSKQHNISVDLMDCTFFNQKEAVEKVRCLDSKVIGIYSIFSMKNRAIVMAKALKEEGKLLVAGGPLPSLKSEDFLQAFDVVAIGEGEETMLDLVREVERGGADLSSIKGIAYREKGREEVKFTPPREFIRFG